MHELVTGFLMDVDAHVENACKGVPDENWAVKLEADLRSAVDSRSWEASQAGVEAARLGVRNLEKEKEAWLELKAELDEREEDVDGCMDVRDLEDGVDQSGRVEKRLKDFMSKILYTVRKHGLLPV